MCRRPPPAVLCSTLGRQRSARQAHGRGEAQAARSGGWRRSAAVWRRGLTVGGGRAAPLSAERLLCWVAVGGRERAGETAGDHPHPATLVCSARQSSDSYELQNGGFGCCRASSRRARCRCRHCGTPRLNVSAKACPLLGTWQQHFPHAGGMCFRADRLPLWAGQAPPAAAAAGRHARCHGYFFLPDRPHSTSRQPALCCELLEVCNKRRGPVAAAIPCIDAGWAAGGDRCAGV